MLRSGANDFVHKPVVPEEFQVRVRNLVQLRQALDHLEEQHRALHEMAMQDRLTGVYNRHYLSERMPYLISEANASSSPLTLIVVDVDHFKRINDNFGHATGDAVLADIAEVLRDQAGKHSLVARLGGEEFIVVLSGSAFILVLPRPSSCESRLRIWSHPACR
jgi:two-component system cell cycle response regulator